MDEKVKNEEGGVSETVFLLLLRDSDPYCDILSKARRGRLVDEKVKNEGGEGSLTRVE